MTERHRIKGDPRLGFAYEEGEELEGEVCADCGEQATVVYETSDGLLHLCDYHRFV